MLYLATASLLWAFSFGLIKGHLGGVDPAAVACARLLLAATAFAPFAWRRYPGRRTALAAAGLGTVQFGLMYVLYLASFRWLPAWVVAMLTVLTPLYVVVLGAWRDGRLRFRHLLAAGLAVAGGAVVTGRSGLAGSAWPGVLLLQAANLCFAVGQIRFAELRRRSGAAETALLGWMYAGAAGFALLATLLMAAGGSPVGSGWDADARVVVLYLGLLPTAVGFYLWNKGAARTAPALLAAANNLKVPLAVLVAWTVFGEDAAVTRAGLGLVLLLAALQVARGQEADAATASH